MPRRSPSPALRLLSCSRRPTERTAVRPAQGEFLLTLLAPGTYRLEVDASGYRRHVQELLLDLNQEMRVEVPLLPGKTTEQVNVTATRSLLRTGIRQPSAVSSTPARCRACRSTAAISTI